MSKKVFKINEDQLMAILAYLAAKPYNEVAQGIQALQSLEVIGEMPEKEEVKEE